MTHYQVLELTNAATAADIKRAYRRLVLVTHPDRTPDPAAHARYLLVNAAYETLSNPARRFAYDAGLRGPAPAPRAPFAPPPPPARPMSAGRARDAARHRRGPRPTGRRRVPDTVRYAAEYARLHRHLRPLLLAVLMLCGSLAIDYFLAAERPETVLDYFANPNSDVTPFRNQTLREANDPASGALLAHLDTRQPLRPGTRLLVRRTLLWKSALTVRTSVVHAPVTLLSVYGGTTRWVLLSLVGCTLFALRRRAAADHRLAAALVALVLLIIVLYKLLH